MDAVTITFSAKDASSQHDSHSGKPVHKELSSQFLIKYSTTHVPPNKFQDFKTFLSFLEDSGTFPSQPATFILV